MPIRRGRMHEKFQVIFLARIQLNLFIYHKEISSLVFILIASLKRSYKNKVVRLALEKLLTLCSGKQE